MLPRLGSHTPRASVSVSLITRRQTGVNRQRERGLLRDGEAEGERTGRGRREKRIEGTRVEEIGREGKREKGVEENEPFL